MGNHTVKKKAAGLNDKTVIVGMQINQKVKEIGEKAEEKTTEIFELESKGKLYRKVIPTEYIVIKAYSNKVKEENLSNPKIQKTAKNKEDDQIK